LPDDVGAALEKAVRALGGIGVVYPGAVPERDVQKSQHVVLGWIDQFGRVGYFGANVVGGLFSTVRTRLLRGAAE